MELPQNLILFPFFHYAFFLDLFKVIIEITTADKVTAEKETNPKMGSYKLVLTLSQVPGKK